MKVLWIEIYLFIELLTWYFEPSSEIDYLQMYITCFKFRVVA